MSKSKSSFKSLKQLRAIYLKGIPISDLDDFLSFSEPQEISTIPAREWQDGIMYEVHYARGI